MSERYDRNDVGGQKILWRDDNIALVETGVERTGGKYDMFFLYDLNPLNAEIPMALRAVFRYELAEWAKAFLLLADEGQYID